MTTTRKTHIKRLFGRDQSGNKLTDVYADIMRADEITVENRFGTITEIITLNWDDTSVDDLVEGEDLARGGRLYDIIKLLPPGETDTENPSIYIPIPVLTRLILVSGGQTTKERWRNRKKDQQNSETGRQITKVRVFNSDTNSDDELNDGNTVPGDVYRRDESGEDGNEDNSVDVEYVVRYPTNLGWDNQTIFRMSNKERFEQINLTLIEQEDAERVVRLDPYQDIVNINWSKHYPKYVAIYGYSGPTNVILYYVDDDGQLRSTSLSNPVGYAGWVTYSETDGDFHYHPAAQVSFARALGDHGGVWTIDSSTASLYSSAFSSEGVPPPLLSPTGPIYVDHRGLHVAGPTEIPEKGIFVNGLWAKNDSVSRYDGDRLVWQRSFDSGVYEVAPGGKVITYNFEVNALSVVTLDMDTGGTKSFILIGDNSIDWDTTSDGSMYVMFTAPSGENWSRTLKKFDVNGNIKWSISLPTDRIQFDAGSPGVCEGRDGTAFVFVATSQDVGTVGDSLTQTVISQGWQIYDGETGALISSQTWSARNHDFYSDEIKDDEGQTISFEFYGAEEHRIRSVESNQRYP